ncbi:hypothetical protein JB92DRAFT_2708583 [Gautieria morchelliformis]|nr:hypothetical protein JB92DRAFT_2708583 [Gautieria morchelliformis]
MRSCSHRRLCSALLIICAGALLLVSQRLALDSYIGTGAPWYAVSGPSVYRQSLSAVRPYDTAAHSRTLGVADRLYVVSLASRADRRQIMSDIARAMDLEFTWHDATDYHTKDVQDILERIRWWRNEHRVNDSVPKADPSPFVFRWADDVDEVGRDLGFSGADLWPDSVGKSLLPPLPPVPTPDTRPPTLDSYGEVGDHFGKAPLRPAQISCWHSHYRVLRRIAEGDDDVAIVFEDDIDMEWDLELRLRRMWPALPEDWDLVMLGHCHSREWDRPALKGAPTLHPASHTLCTHAYAVNRRAAQRMVRRMRSEPFAYSRTVDHAIQHLSSYREIKVFSVFPQVVIQTYETESDIAPGRSKDRMHWLEDGVRDRMALVEELSNTRPDSAGAAE